MGAVWAQRVWRCKRAGLKQEVVVVEAEVIAERSEECYLSKTRGLMLVSGVGTFTDAVSPGLRMVTKVGQLVQTQVRQESRADGDAGSDNRKLNLTWEKKLTI